MARFGIAGAGVLGRLMAWQLAELGHEVHVFDPATGPQAPRDGLGSGSTTTAAGFTAAGMLSPLAELDHAEADIAGWGWRSIQAWQAITQKLQAQLPNQSAPLLQIQGSLLVAHGSDLGAALRALARIESPTIGAPWPHQPQRLTPDELARLEPSLSERLHAWLLPGEAHILPRQTLEALCHSASTVQWHWQRSVSTVQPHAITLTNGQQYSVDWAIDVRGRGDSQCADLRGVRGEVIALHAPGLVLTRPIRLLHPRHRVYIVPRPNEHVLVGATEIESEDRSPVSLRSAVELMAAAQSVIPELAEARIVNMASNLRPALPDHRPQTLIEPGLIRINGLFRHGWLLAPALVEDALALMEVSPCSTSDPTPRSFLPEYLDHDF